MPPLANAGLKRKPWQFASLTIAHPIDKSREVEEWSCRSQAFALITP